VEELYLASMVDLFITQGDSAELTSLVDSPGNYECFWQPP